ncbi:MAG: DUF2975 domain-containing protein [Flavobacteriaceae bacterium]|nr:DUF2975 domain-containing protein [Flavobacteriaceae bacterium]
MKKIKILHGFLVALILLYLFFFYEILFNNPFPDTIHKNTLFGFSTFNLESLFYIFLFLGLIFIQQGLFLIIKKGFFNTKSAKYFKAGGFLIIVYGLLFFSVELLLFIKTMKGEDFLIIRAFQAIPLLIIGFGLLIISDIIKNGKIIKQENELTI